MTSSSNELTIPSKETIEYGRRVIQAEIDLFKRFCQQALDKGEPDQAREWRKRAGMLQMKFMGGEGCVIRPFDSRWLDDDFRAIMENVRREIEEDQAR